LAGFDLITPSSSLLDGRRRRYHYIDHAARALEDELSYKPHNQII
jgi:hypothetical protein